MRRLTYTLLAIVIFALLTASYAFGEDSTPNPTPSPESTEIVPTVGDVTVNVNAPAPTEFPAFNPSTFVGVGLAYLIYLATLAGFAQGFIAKLLPINDWIDKSLNLDEKGVAVRLNVERFVAGLISMFAVGGVIIVRGILAPVLAFSPVLVPDFVLGLGTSILLMAGQDLIYAWIKNFYAGDEALNELHVPKQTIAVEPTAAQTAQAESVNRGRY